MRTMTSEGPLKGFVPSSNFSIRRALKVYRGAVDAGFYGNEALERVKAAQFMVEWMAGKLKSEL